MKRDNDIIRLTKINNVRILNKHNGYLFPYQNILEILMFLYLLYINIGKYLNLDLQVIDFMI